MGPTPRIPVRGGTFVVEANGFADGPSQALVEFLVQRGAARVLSIAHPLVPEGPHHHAIEDTRGGVATSRVVRAPFRAPYTYVLDPMIPLRVPRSDGWFGFNCLATSRALVARRRGLTRRVVHWSVDFVPERFGPGLATRVYEKLDRWCCVHADARVDLSEAALEARAQAYAIPLDRARAFVVPMGAWLSRTPKIQPTNWTDRRIVFLGHLVPRMGVATLLDALELLEERGLPFACDIIGGGPLIDDVRRRVCSGALADRVTIHGFIEDHREVERMLAKGAVAVAPYEEDPSSFSRFADPGKLKAYLGAGLPIILTGVPPIAKDLAEHGGAEIVEGSGQAFADALQALLAEPAEWERRRRCAAEFARRFDWDDVLSNALRDMGFDV